MIKYLQSPDLWFGCPHLCLPRRRPKTSKEDVNDVVLCWTILLRCLRESTGSLMRPECMEISRVVVSPTKKYVIHQPELMEMHICVPFQPQWPRHMARIPSLRRFEQPRRICKDHGPPCVEKNIIQGKKNGQVTLYLLCYLQLHFHDNKIIPLCRCPVVHPFKFLIHFGIRVSSLLPCIHP